MEDDYFTPAQRKLDDLFTQWAEREDLDRSQTAFVDVYWALGRIGNGGIHGFWESLSEQADRIIESFRIVGEGGLAEMLDQSRFILKADVDDEGFYRLSDEETELVSEAEDILLEDSFISRLSEFVQTITSDVE